MKKMLLIVLILNTYLANAEIQIYQDTDNTGQNKLERIGVIEKYLIDLSNSVKKMDEKLDENAKKIKTLEADFKEIKNNDLKKLQTLLGEKKEEGGEDGELKKIKADILAIKNDDIEKLKSEVMGLNNIIKSIQGIMQSQLK